MHISHKLFSVAILIVAAGVSSAAQQIIATIPVGNGPIGSGADPGTDQIYVVNAGSNTAMDIDGGTNTVVYTVPVGATPASGDINRKTKKGYIAANGSNTVTIVDLPTGHTSTVTVGSNPEGVAVNPVTNKIYVCNRGTDLSPGHTVSVIDGATGSVTATITVGSEPRFVAVNQVTNRIYVSDRGDGNGNGQGITIINGANNSVITTITSVSRPNDIAVNSLTNRIYVVNKSSNYVTVIDGATNNATPVTVGYAPDGIGANFVTNKIYVANQCGNDPQCQSAGTVSVINGANNTVVDTVTVGFAPVGVGVDMPANKIYVSNAGSNTVTLINGINDGTTTANVGTQPQGVTVNPATNRIYISNYGSNNVSVMAGANAAPAQFVPITPCRLVDTRITHNPILGGTSQNFVISQLGGCNIPASAAGYSLNVTVVPHGALGYLTIWPTGEDQPTVSTMNSLDARVKANAAIVPAGYQGAVSIYASNTTDVVLDINGYFAQPGGQTYQFYWLPPCRVVDTRRSDFPPGLGTPHLSAGVPRDFPVLTSHCLTGITNAVAYSLNFTAIPYPSLGYGLGYLEVWPTGHQPQHPVSTLNNPTGTYVANAAIVPAGSSGEITAYASNDTDLAIDINGYFAPAGANGLSFYPTAPCRVLDTRSGNGQPFTGERTVDVENSICSPPAASQAYAFNATVVPSPSLSYLTLWPDGQNRPVVSTLNAVDGWITSNMAVVPTTNGSIDAYAAGTTHLILDISGYFAP